MQIYNDRKLIGDWRWENDRMARVRERDISQEHVRYLWVINMSVTVIVVIVL